MTPYATITRTKANLAAMRANGFRLLVTPETWAGGHRPGWEYALDNGAWSAHQRGEPFPEAAFREMVSDLAAGCDWLVVPDIVASPNSLEFSRQWIRWCLDRAPRVLLAAQDGMEPKDVASLVGPRVGVAIGGSTEWKLQQLGRKTWGRMCRAKCAHLHALRVNTKSRIELARYGGCHSFDGKSATLYKVNAPKIARWTQNAIQQEELFR